MDNTNNHREVGVDQGETNSESSLFSAFFRMLGKGFLRLVDSVIPNEMRDGDPDQLRRARIIFSFTIVLVMLGLETTLFFAWMLPKAASIPVALSLAAALSCVLFIPVALRNSDSLAISANLMLAAAYIVTVTIFTVIGGIQSPLIHWLALFPMLAILMGTRNSAWAWTGISLATAAFFIAADQYGFEFQDLVGFSNLDGTVLWFQRAINLGSWLGILLGVSLLFEDQKNRQTSQLAAQNAELASQVDSRVKAEKRSNYLAYYDELTGLPNRHFFLEQLSIAIELTSRLDRKIALLFLDLDKFKEVNDLHGHALGDQLLTRVSERLVNCVRATDSISLHEKDQVENVARLGGDEFTILLRGIHEPQDASLVAERILEAMRKPFDLDELQLHIGTSIGIALCSRADMEAGDLLRNADLAMYQAKAAGKNNYKFHDDSMNTDIALRNTTTDALREALYNGELELHYQPIVDGKRQNIVGVEALLRWNRNDEGYVSTETLVKLAEESGLIVPVGNWVINQACRQYHRWRKEGVQLRRMAINVSGEQFRHASVVFEIEEALRKYGIDPATFEIEITEGAMMVDEEKTLQALRELKKLGVGIALDDFGTGYSSLSYIHRFPVDAIKIDRSFVSDITRDQSSQAIAMAVIALAHQLDLRVVGEGVENVLQERFLLEKGCDEMQGYLYSKPVPPGEISKLLSGETKTTAASSI